jgi:hypothetical protein
MNPILRGGTLKPLWQFSVSGTIWRIATDGSSHIIGEERDVQQKKASFFCLERGSGGVLWSGRRLGEDWWIGMEACVGGVLYLHGFATPELPGHRGITAVDVRTGTVLWADEQIMFLAASEGNLHAVRGGITGNQISELDPRSGEVRQTFRADDRLLHSIRNTGTGSANEVAFPGPLPDGEASDVGVGRLVRERPGAGMIGYIDHPITPVLTSSISQGGAEPGDIPSRDWILEVFDRRSGEVVLMETLSQKTHWTVQETVFVLQNTLYFVRDYRTLVAVSLGSVEG